MITTLHDLENDSGLFYDNDWCYNGDKIVAICGRDDSNSHLAEDEIQIYIKTENGQARIEVNNQEIVRLTGK